MQFLTYSPLLSMGRLVQSPIIDCQQLNVATAAVSAFNSLGPRPIGIAYDNPRSSVCSAGLNPPTGPTASTHFKSVLSFLLSLSASSIGFAGPASAANISVVFFGQSCKRSFNFLGCSILGIVKRPHCSAASITIASIRSKLNLFFR